jgi:hypothetical protein
VSIIKDRFCTIDQDQSMLSKSINIIIVQHRAVLPQECRRLCSHDQRCACSGRLRHGSGLVRSAHPVNLSHQKIVKFYCSEGPERDPLRLTRGPNSVTIIHPRTVTPACLPPHKMQKCPHAGTFSAFRSHLSSPIFSPIFLCCLLHLLSNPSPTYLLRPFFLLQIFTSTYTELCYDPCQSTIGLASELLAVIP